MPARLLAILLGISPAAAAEPPAALVEATEEAAAACRELGGTPSILAGYQTVKDLNGDGRDDFLTDLAHLECAGAWSAFCGSAGCPVSAWLSAPDGGYVRFDFGYLEGIEIHDGKPLPRLVAGYHGTLCDDPDRIGADICTRTWTFASNAPETPPVDAAAAPAQPEARTAPAPPSPAIPPGWTLRAVPGASPAALGGGTGSIALVTAFCLGGQPFLAVTFHERPAADTVTLGFDFSQGHLDAPARFEAGAGGAYVVALADGGLAARLAGRDREVPLAVDGAPQGKLSLAGSSKALRGALEACRPK